ncbi:hypothetical protein BDD12DRAFT_169981 [Trichophaea hybrida]|nr:hypothetical protein BDD12DRAFT_169981 [Trichophaea hybrida]
MGGLANFQHRMYKNWLLVSTTSPRLENTKAMQKALSPMSIYLPTWTWEELVCAANTQDEPLLRRLYSNFLKYGPIARVLLDKLSVIDLSERLNILKKQADNTVSNKINACLKSTNLQSILLQQFSTQDSHAIFMMEPVLDDGCSLKLCSIEYAYSFRSE